MKGLGLLTERPSAVTTCKRHYGFKRRTQFSAWRNDSGEATVDHEGIKWASDQVRWLFRKGDVIPPDKEITETLKCNWDVDARDLEEPKKRQSKAAGHVSGSGPIEREIVFVATMADDAPVRYSDISDSLLPFPPR
jgi:hypothetical protein